MTSPERVEHLVAARTLDQAEQPSGRPGGPVARRRDELVDGHLQTGYAGEMSTRFWRRSRFRDVRMLFSLSESASCKKGNHMQIAGSSAIVVGGAGGLGEATVRRLHGAGAKVVVADLADDKGKALESELGVRYVPHRRHLRGVRQRGDRRGGVACSRCGSRSTPTAVPPAAAG